MATIPFDIVGFDLDGTLLDSHADLGAAVNHALGLAGREPVPIAELRTLIGGGGRTMLKRALLLTGGVPEAEFPALHDALIAHYEANIAVHTRLFPGGEAMLDGLAARGIKLAVVTNKLESLTLRLLDALELTSRFYTVIGGDTLGPGRAKPSRDPIDLMIARGLALGAGGRAAFVGDTTFDTGAAQAADIPCVAVSFGFNDAPPHELGAQAVIHHFDALIPALENLPTGQPS
jgi:phosphoglycolate phosphatase